MTFEIRTLSDHVLDSVVLAVMERRVPFGSRLKESDIANSLNVSRMPVREALMRLVSEGVVTNTPYRGMCLMDVDDKKLKHILDVRLALERLAFRSVIERIRAGECDMSDAEAALEEMRRMVRGDRNPVFARYDILYHRAIINLSNNSTLIKMWEMMARQFLMIVGVAWTSADPVALVDAHINLHRLLASLDEDAVDQALGPHIMEALEFGTGVGIRLPA